MEIEMKQGDPNERTPTVKVKNPAEPGGYMVINRDDFVEGEHELFDEEEQDEGSGSSGGSGDGIDYTKLNKDDLKSLMDARGIAHKTTDTKDQLVAALVAADSASTENQQ
jgi:hypothetical protein